MRTKSYEFSRECVDCGEIIGRRATRCSSCAAKARQRSGAYDNSYNSKEYRQKKSDELKARWKDGVYDGVFDEECLRKRSVGLKAAHARGAFAGEGCLRKISEGLRAAHARGCYDGVFQSPTSIELQVAAALDIMGIEHKSQYRPDGYGRIYDEFIPPNILVEVQGDYFHSDEHFPGIEKRDAEKALWARDNEYNLIAIWEHEIKEGGAWSVVQEKLGGRNEP